MEKNKKSKSKILFILLFVLIIVFLINTSAVFFTANLASAVSKIFDSITIFVSNSLLFSDVKPPLKKITPEYGTKCELVVTEGLTKQWSFKICVATNTSTKRLCNQNSDCDPFFRPIPPPLLSGTRCQVDSGFIGFVEMRCIVDPLMNGNYCYSSEDCKKTFKECDSFTKKCLETAGLGSNTCKTDNDCK